MMLALTGFLLCLHLQLILLESIDGTHGLSLHELYAESHSRLGSHLLREAMKGLQRE